jgi:hypothetical protein
MFGCGRKFAGQSLHALATAQHAPALAEMTQPGAALPAIPEPVPFGRAPAHYLWALLIARIFEAFPLLRPLCGGQMRTIAFITHSALIRHMLDHTGVQSEPPRIPPARGPPLWEDGDAQVGEGAKSNQTGEHTGMGRCKPHPTMRQISASTGEPIGEELRQRFRRTAGEGCLCGGLKKRFRAMGGLSNYCGRSSCADQGRWAPRTCAILIFIGLNFLSVEPNLSV